MGEAKPMGPLAGCRKNVMQVGLRRIQESACPRANVAVAGVNFALAEKSNASRGGENRKADDEWQGFLEGAFLGVTRWLRGGSVDVDRYVAHC